MSRPIDRRSFMQRAAGASTAVKRPACDIEDGYRSSATCLLGNVALRTRERIEFDPAKQELVQPSAAARKLFGREYRAPWKLTA